MIDVNSLDDYSCRAPIPCKCERCGKPFTVPKNTVLRALKATLDRDRKALYKGRYCSKVCRLTRPSTAQEHECQQCHVKVMRIPSQVGGKVFCSQSCSATYHNTHKTHGTRRSKLEVWLEQELAKRYPALDIHYARKDAINGELDIYVSSIRLAFELNGIFHYEPIYGANKLAQIKNNDQRKYQACIERGIELCTIDTSSFKYFKADRAKPYLDIITKLIDLKLEHPTGFEPATVVLQGRCSDQLS